MKKAVTTETTAQTTESDAQTTETTAQTTESDAQTTESDAQTTESNAQTTESTTGSQVNTGESLTMGVFAVLLVSSAALLIVGRGGYSVRNTRPGCWRFDSSASYTQRHSRAVDLRIGCFSDCLCGGSFLLLSVAAWQCFYTLYSSRFSVWKRCLGCVCSVRLPLSPAVLQKLFKRASRPDSVS